ncbi:methyltransferase [Xylaria sp. FL1042]|nr:methyltransferase [Xylaria sp. FL1042]
MTTTATFNYIDPTSAPDSTGKHWTKVDGGGLSYKHRQATHAVHNLREGAASQFNTDVAGFGLQRWPSSLSAHDFADDAAVRGAYYADTEAVLRANCDALGSNVSAGNNNNKVRKVVIFDHTIRRRDPTAPRGPVQQVHVDQTPAAAVARVRRHCAPEEVEDLLKRRFQLINVWRPIAHVAADHPLAVIDWRSTDPGDFVPVQLLYPKRADSVMDDDDDDRGKEKLPDASNVKDSTEGYEVRGETMGVAASDKHRFYYVKDMTPDEVLLLKCYDSWGEGEPDGKKGLAVRTPHTAFEDPATPADAKPRESIEVRALVFYEK